MRQKKKCKKENKHTYFFKERRKEGEEKEGGGGHTHVVHCPGIGIESFLLELEEGNQEETKDVRITVQPEGH